jgi:antitoxin component HigA of HigAB toxin-antitoxin module
MNKRISKLEYVKAESKMEKLLEKATQRGGFEFLTEKEAKDLAIQTEIVRLYESEHMVIPMPDTLHGIIELKMFELKLKQKELAKLLQTSDTQLSEIMHQKRKPSVAFLKSIHQFLGIEGNLLLKLA